VLVILVVFLDIMELVKNGITNVAELDIVVVDGQVMVLAVRRGLDLDDQRSVNGQIFALIADTVQEVVHHLDCNVVGGWLPRLQDERVKVIDARVLLSDPS
jgi:hypothetical protein